MEAEFSLYRKETHLSCLGVRPLAVLLLLLISRGAGAAWIDGETAQQRRRAFLNALAEQTPPARRTIKETMAYYQARMLGAPPDSPDFRAARSELERQLQAARPTTPFEVHSAMHGYMLSRENYTPAMIAATKRILQDFTFVERYVSENYYLMANASAYIASEQWPEFTTTDGQRGPDFRALLKQRLSDCFNRFVRSNIWEHDAHVYLATDLMAIRFIAEFARDAQLKNQARLTLDWFLLNIACDWNQGYYVATAGRGKRWSSAQSSPDEPGTTPLIGWIYYGGLRPVQIRHGSPGGEFFHVFWMAYFRDYQVPKIFQAIATARAAPFRHQASMWRGDDASVWKYTWHTPAYSLASQYDEVPSALDAFYKEQRRVMMKWVSDRPESTLTLGMENHRTPHRLGGNNYLLGRNPMAYGDSPYAQYLQHQQTLIGVSNVSPWYADQSGEESDPVRLGELDPLKYADFYVPLTRRGAILKTVEAGGWVFCHGGSVLFALRTIQPYRWGPDENGCRMLRSRGLKNGWILETAEACRYPEAGIDRQLQNLQDEIRYSRAAWPLLENPWVRQAAGGALLTLQIDGLRRVYDFDRWRVLGE